MLLAGCASGPDVAANKFVKATLDQKFVEANGYLAEELADGSASTAGLIGDSAKADFRVTEASDTSAKVESASDSRDYMVLSKVDRNWKISEVGFFSDQEESERIPFETNVTEDPDAWEDEDIITKRGEDGEATIRVTTSLINGESSEDGRQRIAVDKAPVSQEVRRPTKPRSAGWISFTKPANSTQPQLAGRFRVTEIRRDGQNLTISWETEGVQRPVQAYVMKNRARRDIIKGIPVTYYDGTKLGGQITETLESRSGRPLEKTDIIFTWGETIRSEYDRSNPTIYAASGYFNERDWVGVWSADKAYPGPVKD